MATPLFSINQHLYVISSQLRRAITIVMYINLVTNSIHLDRDKSKEGGNVVLAISDRIDRADRPIGLIELIALIHYSKFTLIQWLAFVSLSFLISSSALILMTKVPRRGLTTGKTRSVPFIPMAIGAMPTR